MSVLLRRNQRRNHWIKTFLIRNSFSLRLQVLHRDVIQMTFILLGCPGVLIVKRAVLPSQQSLPTEPGGGTVFYVTEEHHRWVRYRTCCGLLCAQGIQLHWEEWGSSCHRNALSWVEYRTGCYKKRIGCIAGSLPIIAFNLFKFIDTLRVNNNWLSPSSQIPVQ